jgi:hypothetical protein
MGWAFGVRGSHGVGLSGPADRRYRRQWRVCAAGKGKPLLPQQLAGQITDPRNIRISPAHARARGRAGLVVASREGYRSRHLGSGDGTTVSTVVSAARHTQALAGSHLAGRFNCLRIEARITAPSAYLLAATICRCLGQPYDLLSYEHVIILRPCHINFILPKLLHLFGNTPNRTPLYRRIRITFNNAAFSKII